MENMSVQYSKDIENILINLNSDDFSEENNKHLTSHLIFNYSLNMDIAEKNSVKTAISSTIKDLIQKDVIKDFEVLKRNLKDLAYDKFSFVGNSNSEVNFHEEKSVASERRKLRENLDFLFNELLHFVNREKFKHSIRLAESGLLDMENKETVEVDSMPINRRKITLNFNKNFMNKINSYILGIF